MKKQTDRSIKQALCGRIIVNVAFNRYDDGRGSTATDPVVVLNDGSQMKFLSIDTETDCGVRILVVPPEGKKTPPDAPDFNPFADYPELVSHIQSHEEIWYRRPEEAEPKRRRILSYTVYPGAPLRSMVTLYERGSTHSFTVGLCDRLAGFRRKG